MIVSHETILIYKSIMNQKHPNIIVKMLFVFYFEWINKNSNAFIFNLILMTHKSFAIQCQKIANVCSPVSLENYVNKSKYEKMLHLYFPT